MFGRAGGVESPVNKKELSAVKFFPARVNVGVFTVTDNDDS
jgi:hypothetical protein